MSSTVRPRVFITPMEMLLGLMACLSVALTLLPQDWLTRRIELKPKNHLSMLHDDSVSGGNSAVSWISQEDLNWRCELGSSFHSPYCSMQLWLIDGQGKGLDLSDFNKLTLWMNYSGDSSHVRVYLRNRHPAYYQTSNDATTKYNMVQLPTAGLNDGVQVALSDFYVADWWLVENRIPLENSHPEFNDVVYLEIQSGSRDFSGTHEFQLQKLVFEGVRFSDGVFYRSIIIIWSVVIFLILLFRIIRLNLELNRNRQYQEELESINGLLNLQNKQFEDLAKTDQLTGLLNRMGIRDALYNGLKDWNLRRKPFSLVIIDIDYFKKINDTYGHDVGDTILQAAAERFKSNVRQSDYLARWGGEEFVLVCPDTTLSQAQHVAETLRSRLESEEVHPGIHITASFGVATLAQSNLDPLFKSADEALYDAKYQGRNRVVCRF